jgi:hypothetical protein
MNDARGSVNEMRGPMEKNQNIYVFEDKMRGPILPSGFFSLPYSFPQIYILQTLCLANN